MCGRFTREYTWAQIHAMYSLTSPASNLQPRYNVCPTTTIDVVVDHQLVPIRRSLVPGWWSKTLKDLKFATFNARAETVAEKPTFRSAFKKLRCLIPASGYYEWRTIGKEKQPYYFTRRDGEVMTIAGLCDTRTDKATGEVLKSCTMAITEPNKLVAAVHDRMPVILDARRFEQWEHGDAKEASALMRPAAENVLQMRPVSKRVNSSRADGDDATLIERISHADPD